MAESASKETKKAIMRDIILKLHEGESIEEAKERFESEIGDITSTEIAELEQGLINDGLSPDEIKKFCNVHALLFESALAKASCEETSPSHPVYLFKLENVELAKITSSLKAAVEKSSDFQLEALREEIRKHLLDLRELELHYERKEQLLFPYLEKQGFMGPSKVMWGKDNEIRDMMRSAFAGLDELSSGPEVERYLTTTLHPLMEEVDGMIFKEENILFPTALEKLDPGDWVSILRQSDEIGYAFIQIPQETDELIRHLQSALQEEAVFEAEGVSLPSGAIDLNELMPLLNTLPFDLTFVDQGDSVKYFSEGGERIFARPRSVIGRKVQNCHPPQSLDVVEEILASFRKGSKDSYEFWMNYKEKFVHIRYFAVRDPKGRYLGTLEVSQDVTNIRSLEGEKRLLDERDRSQ